MIVCHCFGLSDRAIRDAARRGEPQLASTGCGGCGPMVEALVQAEQTPMMVDGPRRTLRLVGRHAIDLPYVPAAAAAQPQD